jgi:hypothetical protein
MNKAKNTELKLPETLKKQGLVIDRGKLDQNGGDFASLLFTLKQR